MVSLIRSHLWAALIVAAYLILGAAFSVANPIHEATDELRHYRYVRYIADYGQLPIQSDEPGNAQAHHPPLYYASAALASFWVHPAEPLYEPLPNPQWGFRNWEVGIDNKNLYLHGPEEAWPYRDVSLAAHLARWVTLLWGAGAVALTIAIARVAFSSRPAIAIAAGALIAFNPMFLYLGGAVNNDVPAALMGAAITYICLRVAQDGLTVRRTFLLGGLYGLALLVKFNLIGLLAVIEIALLVSAAGDGDAKANRWKFAQANAIIIGLALIVAGWWYARNAILYGEPTGFLRLTEIWGFRPPRVGLALAWRELAYAWSSLWARFGYGQIPVPDTFYAAIGVLCGMGVAGLALLVIRSRDTEEESTSSTRLWIGRTQRHVLLVLASSVFVNFATLYAYIVISPAGAMGRFFFPGLPAFATLVAVGLLGPLPEVGQRFGTVMIGLGMIACALIALCGYLIPAYAIPPAVTSPPEPLNIEVGDVARILAYEVTPETVLPGQPIDVTITWEVIRPTEQPYALFIHVLNPDGALIAQRDTYTGLGNYPSQWWRPGHIYTETYRIYLPQTAYTPDIGLVEVGLYNPDLGRLPISTSQATDSALGIGQVELAADPSAEYPNQIFVNWDNHFALVGYTIEPRVLHPGEKTWVTLYWQALDPPREEDFKVFLHVMEGWDNQWAGNDGNPVEPDGFTRYWVAGQVYEDRRKLRLPPDIPPGEYVLELGWFSDTDGERLNILASDGHIIDNWLALNTIRVLPHE